MSSGPITVEEKGFLRYIHEQGLSRLEPRVTPEGIVFGNLTLGDYEWKQVLFLLKSLSQKDYLDEEDFDRAIFCPTCDSPHVYSKYACPVDKSIFIKKITLYQHTTDGFQGEKELFQKEVRLVCPKCGNDLGHSEDVSTHDPTLKEIGFSYECEKGGHKFERPSILHFCPDCSAIFNYKTARYVPLFSYELNDKAVKLLSEDIDIEQKLRPLYSYLGSKGFKVSYDVQMTGVSGSSHSFDLSADSDTVTIVFDYSLGDTTKLVSLLGKKMDLPGREAILLDFSDNDELLKLSKVYNIPVLRTQGSGWKLHIDSLLNSVVSKQKSVPRRNIWGRKRE